jgi:hypothetical protein
VIKVLGSTLASSNTVELERRQMKNVENSTEKPELSLITLWIRDPLLLWSLDPFQDRKRLDPGKKPLPYLH